MKKVLSRNAFLIRQGFLTGTYLKIGKFLKAS